ncbi:MAG TPA: Hsp20/alpha crystallin family protein [Pyrinomonadaceae bacterium]|nr:Hsp20/alpha crystallin family protein [Pyrinomonadaceae bacterium]
MKETKENMELAQRTPETVNPFLMMRRFTQDMERLFEEFQGFEFPRFFQRDFVPFRMEFNNVEWVPQIEVLHKNELFMVRADLPGLTKDDVKVELTNELLTISGERKEEKEEKREGLYRSERRYGSFYRQVPLPEGATTEKAEATFHNGVLEITIPAAKLEPSIRKLEIKEPVQQKAAKATA